MITERVPPGVVYTTFHHPMTQANVVTTEYSDWATNCPEYKVTAVQVTPSNGPSEWQEDYEELARQAGASPKAAGRGGIDGRPPPLPDEEGVRPPKDRLVYMANQIGKFFGSQRKDEVVPKSPITSRSSGIPACSRRSTPISTPAAMA